MHQGQLDLGGPQADLEPGTTNPTTIPLERLRVGVVTGASWGNAGKDIQEDYWQETSERRLRFHPDLHTISRAKTMVINGMSTKDTHASRNLGQGRLSSTRPTTPRRPRNP